jgi:hypothetical protein
MEDYKWRFVESGEKVTLELLDNELASVRTVLQGARYFGTVFATDHHPAFRVRDRLLKVPHSYENLVHYYFDLLTTKKCLNRTWMPVAPGRVLTESGVVANDLTFESIEENFNEFAGDEVKEVNAGNSAYPATGQEEVLGIADFFARPVEIATLSLTAGADFFTNYDVWDLFTANPSIRAKLRNYAYFSANLHLRVSISGSPFHYGRVLLSYQPFPASNGTLTRLLAANITFPTMKPLLINYLSQSDGAVTMDIKSNKPVEMEIPFISTKPMMRLFNTSALVLADTSPYADMEYAGALHLATINPVASTSSTPSVARMQIVAWATNVKLGAPTGTQIAITTESGVVDERETGPVEKVSTKLAEISGALSRVPSIGHLALASEMLFSSVSRFAAIFGWSRPVMIDEPMIVKNQPFQNGAQTIGAETNYRLTIDPKQELTVDPSIGGCSRDEMVIADIANRTTYLTSFNWLENTAPMSVFWMCRNSPYLHTKDSGALYDFYQPTAMCYAVTPFAAWSGKIVYRFEIVASAFHRGKLAIFFEPNVAQYSLINTNMSTNKQFLAVVDIQETQVFEVCVEWGYPRQWAGVSHVYTDEYGATISSSNPTYCNGYIGVMPFTSLQSPDGSDIPINVYVRCENMRVNELTDRRFPNQRRIRTESGVVPQEDFVCTPLNKSVVSFDNASLYHYGEEPLSFRSMLKRYVSTAEFNYNMAAVTVGHIEIVEPNMPVNVLPYGATARARTTFDLFSYLRMAFLGFRGSIRKRVHISGNEDAQIGDQVKVTRGGVAGGATPGISFIAAVADSALQGTVTFAQHSNAGVEYEAPFYSRNLYALAFADDMQGTINTDEMETAWSKTCVIDIDTHKPGAFYMYAQIETAAGEDFGFFRYQGAPYFSV